MITPFYGRFQSSKAGKSYQLFCSNKIFCISATKCLQRIVGCTISLWQRGKWSSNMGKRFLKALTKSWHYAQSSDAQDNKLSFNKKAFKDKKNKQRKNPPLDTMTAWDWWLVIPKYVYKIKLHFGAHKMCYSHSELVGNSSYCILWIYFECWFKVGLLVVLEMPPSQTQRQ